MKHAEWDERMEQLLEIESVEPEQWIYMSFCDTDLPKGTQFLGAIVTKAKGPMHATAKTHELGINPGGEILFVPPPEGWEPRPGDVDRLLSKEEALNLGE